MPTIAASTMLLGGLGGPIEALRFIADHGFHGLEIGARLLTDEHMPVPVLREVRVLATANGIDLSVHAPTGWDPSTFNPEERAQYLSEMEALSQTMGQIGARVLVLHAGKVSGPGIDSGAVSESTRLNAIESLTEFLHSCSSMAEDHGVVVCLENLPYMPGEYDSYGVWRCYDVLKTYGELVQVVRDTNSPAVKITLDIGHADRAEGIRPAFEEFAPYLRHVHVHDSDGVRDHQELGSAKVDFVGLSELLQPFPHMLVIEVRGGEEPAATSLRNLNFLKQVVGWAGR